MLLVQVSNRLHFISPYELQSSLFYVTLLTSFFLFLLGFPFNHFQDLKLDSPLFASWDICSVNDVSFGLGNSTISQRCDRQLLCVLPVLLCRLPPLRAITLLRQMSQIGRTRLYDFTRKRQADDPFTMIAVAIFGSYVVNTIYWGNEVWRSWFRDNS
jgi:hypothetical protein